MALSFKSVSLAASTLLLLGASFGTAGAMPVAAIGVRNAGVEQAAYLHRHYPGYDSRSARRYRHARRNTPNRFCQNQPSRCR